MSPLPSLWPCVLCIVFMVCGVVMLWRCIYAIAVVDFGCCGGLWLLQPQSTTTTIIHMWLMLVHLHVYSLSWSWRAQATLHQLSCDLGRRYVPWKTCGVSINFLFSTHHTTPFLYVEIHFALAWYRRYEVRFPMGFKTTISSGRRVQIASNLVCT